MNQNSYLVSYLLFTLTFPNLDRVFVLSLELNIESVVKSIKIDTFMTLFEYSYIDNVFQIVAGPSVDTEAPLPLEGQNFGVFIDNHHFNFASYEKRCA
jgi:hypothetical protein